MKKISENSRMCPSHEKILNDQYAKTNIFNKKYTIILFLMQIIFFDQLESKSAAFFFY